MSTFDTPTSHLTQYDRPKVGVIQQGPRESEGRRMVRESMEKKAKDLREKLGR